MWQKFLVLVYSDRPLEERAEVLGISHGSVPTIVHDGLDITIQIPLQCTNVNKSISLQHLVEALWVRGSFFLHLRTLIETGLLFHQWVGSEFQRPMFKMQPSADKVIATLAQYSVMQKVIYYVEPFTQESTQNGVNYANLSDQGCS